MLERFRYLAIAFVLVVLTLVTTGNAAERAYETSSSEVNLADFCGQPPAALSCPRTGAIRCVCYLSGKKAETSSSHAPLWAPRSVAMKAPRRARQARLLPQPSQEFTLLPWVQAPPTPPPRG